MSGEVQSPGGDAQGAGRGRGGGEGLRPSADAIKLATALSVMKQNIYGLSKLLGLINHLFITCLAVR